MQEVKLGQGSRIKLILEGADGASRDFVLSKATMGMARDIESQLDASGGKGSTEILLGMLCRCGLPREVAEAIPADEVENLISVLMPSKKKN